jgi:hypothetical protein
MRLRCPAEAQGVELSGGHTYRGYHYSLAVVNQNTGGTPSSGNTVPPVVGYVSDSNFKDLYGRFSYRVNLERDPASRNEVQAAGATGPRDHTYLNLGTFYFYGRSVQRFNGFSTDGVTPLVLTAREPFYRLGADFSFNYHALNLYGLYLYGHDKNLLPFTNATQGPNGFISGVPATFSGGFLQADYMVLPWVMGIMRYDVVKSSADRINGFGAAVSPLSATRNRITPGIQFLIHANIKAAFEYQIRPQQTVFDTSGNQIAKPFRTNSAVADLEFVY